VTKPLERRIEAGEESGFSTRRGTDSSRREGGRNQQEMGFDLKKEIAEGMKKSR
jgi:hypothetical protein